MKKFTMALITLVGLLSLNSCLSAGLFIVPIEQGYYSASKDQVEEPEKTANVVIEAYLNITGIDADSSPYASHVSGWSTKSFPGQRQSFTIDAGVHSFSIKFSDGNSYTPFGQVVYAYLEAGASYQVIYHLGYGSKISYDIINVDTLDSALVDINALKGNSKAPVSAFINAVLNPTMEGTDKTVVEENGYFILTNLPGMKFELLDKETGKVIRGYRGFETDINFKKGTVYLYETDSISSKEEFLKTNYKEESGIILEVTDCTGDTVTYTYVMPEDMAGKTVTFNISVLD